MKPPIVITMTAHEFTACGSNERADELMADKLTKAGVPLVDGRLDLTLGWLEQYLVPTADVVTFVWRWHA